jgi:hypothetical protein
MRNAFKVLFQKRTLGRCRHRWKDNFKMHLREIGLEGVDWIHVTQDMDQWWVVANIVP